MNESWSQVPSAPNPANRTFPVAVTDDGPVPFSGDLTSTFSQTTFIIRSSPWRTSNIGSPSPTRRMIRNIDLPTAGLAAGAGAAATGRAGVGSSTGSGRCAGWPGVNGSALAGGADGTCGAGLGPTPADPPVGMGFTASGIVGAGPAAGLGVWGTIPPAGVTVSTGGAGGVTFGSAGLGRSGSTPTLTAGTAGPGRL